MHKNPEGLNLKYYRDHLEEYIDETFNCDMSKQYKFFIDALPGNAHTILDIGFGSARDLLYFKKNGYEVYGIDTLEAFCDNAKKLGITNIYNKKAQDIDFIDLFDGIWACSSLLHVPLDELKDTFKKCSLALKKDGVMYISFKYGDFEGINNGRYFVNLTEKTLKNLLVDTNLTIKDIFISDDVRKDKQIRWLNALLVHLH